MPFTPKDIIFGGVMPGMVAATVMLVVRRISRSDTDRHAASLATVSGFLVGYGLLSLAPWKPAAHWHWLPYALLVAAAVGPITCIERISRLERLVLYSLVALVAGCALVPSWEDLVPSRTVHLAVFTIYVVVSAFLLRPLLAKHTGPVLPVVLWATMTATAIVLALSGSLRFAQIALAMAGALFGIVVVASVWRDDCYVNGVALMFSIATVGSLLIGRVNSFSEVPLASYLIIPVAPLSAWCGSMRPFSRLNGLKQTLARVALPLALLAIAVAMAGISEFNDAGGEY